MTVHKYAHNNALNALQLVGYKYIEINGHSDFGPHRKPFRSSLHMSDDVCSHWCASLVILGTHYRTENRQLLSLHLHCVVHWTTVIIWMCVCLLRGFGLHCCCCCWWWRWKVIQIQNTYLLHTIVYFLKLPLLCISHGICASRPGCIAARTGHAMCSVVSRGNIAASSKLMLNLYDKPRLAVKQTDNSGLLCSSKDVNKIAATRNFL